MSYMSMAAITGSNRHSRCGRCYKTSLCQLAFSSASGVGRQGAEDLTHSLSLLSPFPQMSPAGGDPLPTQAYTSLLPRTEDPEAQTVQNRQP